jgi:mono/diheme cytochrome c family protein
VLLALPRMAGVQQMAVQYDLQSADGTPMASTAYLTVHRTPELELTAAGFPPLDWDAAMARAEQAEAVRAAASSAEAGAELVRTFGCIACHSLDGTEGLGPSFRGTYGTLRPLQAGEVRHAQEDYLRQSILDPSSEIVRGFEEGMPSYAGVLSDAEIESIILYIRSLR